MSLVTPVQAGARLGDFAAESLVDMALVPPMADLAPDELPARQEFGSSQDWLSARCNAYEVEGDRIEAHWRALAANCGVEVLSASGRQYLHVQGKPAALAALLAAPDLEQAYFLTDASGPCGSDQAPWVYRVSKHESSRLGGGEHAVDAPLGLLCAEYELNSLSEVEASTRASVLRSAEQDLRWAQAELESPDGHPRHAEYVRRVQAALHRIAEAQSALSST